MQVTDVVNESFMFEGVPGLMCSMAERVMKTGHFSKFHDQPHKKV